MLLPMFGPGSRYFDGGVAEGTFWESDFQGFTVYGAAIGGIMAQRREVFAAGEALCSGKLEIRTPHFIPLSRRIVNFRFEIGRFDNSANQNRPWFSRFRVLRLGASWLRILAASQPVGGGYAQLGLPLVRFPD